MKYAAFIRGINVGGKVLVKMAELQRLFEKQGATDVKTILASGNVVFDSPQKASALEKLFEGALKKKYGRDILVLIRSVAELKKIDAAKPFKGIEVTQQTKLYVTFLAEKPKSAIHTEHPGYRILRSSGRELYSVLVLSPDVQTPDLMKVTGNLGKRLTMRNWNTVQKVLKAA